MVNNTSNPSACWNDEIRLTMLIVLAHERLSIVGVGKVCPALELSMLIRHRKWCTAPT